jgi:hypothetical protein
MQEHVTVKEWVSMFEEIGLDDSTMMQWHCIFETRHPEAHQGFLQWLGLPPDEIQRIRTTNK